MRGDLDNIVLVALRKEPHRRYATVEQFATDIRRHLANLPLVASRDTARYRASKFVVRHKAGVFATTAVALILITGIMLTVRESRIAMRRFNDVRALANSLIFDVHDSIKHLPGSTPARKIIVDRAFLQAATLASPEATAAHPNVQALYTLADSYTGLGDVESRLAATPSRKRAIDHRRAACASYEKSLEAWNQLKEPGIVSPWGFPCIPPALVSSRLQKCKAILNSRETK